MTIEETIQAEKQRLEAALDVVTAPGATMAIQFPEGGSLTFDVDGFVVLRAVPQVDAAGKVREWRYDLMFREVGYHAGMQYVHLVSAATVTQPHGESVVLVDEHGNRYVANAVEPDIDPERRKLFADWRVYKGANAEMFDRIDRQLTDEYTAMVEAGDR